MATLTLPDRTLAYQQRFAAPPHLDRPGVIFLGGFASDMNGTKALFLEERCEKAGLSFLRFDYRGHGKSSDRFENGTIGDWLDDSLQLFDAVTKGPQIVVGSSMGGWIGMLLARARPERTAAFLGIATAADFTEDLVKPILTPAMKEQLAQEGFTYDPGEEDRGSAHSQVPITQRLLDEGQNHLVLREPFPYRGPIRLVQGMKDSSVPWRHALKIVDHAESQDVQLTLIKDADHRLSRAQDLEKIWQTLENLIARQSDTPPS